ncbi:cilia- and flagella-associated protein 74 [Megachile rotundata]|uniref:cilia- and flagella-associated protein 74 n=1 Tax=Megachile rotundata TaxID=143995 RepID=UPI003FD4151D
MIIERITKEMINGIRMHKRPADIRVIKKMRETKFEIYDEESSTEIHFEEAQNEEEDSDNRLKNIAITEITDKSVKKNVTEGQKSTKSKHESVKDSIKSEHIDKNLTIAARKRTESVQKLYPEDTCFFATPSTVIFDDFKVNKVYNKKVTITNKTTKWAYLRFHEVYTDVWEPVVEIDIIDAAKVKPGLHVTVNVKFSPVNDEKVTAEISFLTLNPDHPNTFHKFRVPVRCTPESPVPIVDPRELKFPSAPIWKYNDSKFKEKALTISNEGRKPFSILIGERKDSHDCFLWFFDEGEVQTARSSILASEKDSNVENNSEEAENDLDRKESQKMYQIEVPPKFKCTLRITFQPRYIGLHHEVLEIYFSSNEYIFNKQDVPIWAEVTGYEIHLDPPCVDLGIVMIDSDVRQQSFNIVNTARYVVEVSMKTPKRLGSQVTVYPKSTIIQPETFSTISVRLIPESSIVSLSKRFYDRTSKMLEFPIRVQILTRESEQPPPLILKVLATLTTCQSLVLEPSYVDLGLVYTHESVNTELSLTNKSLLIQEYAFFNLPPFMEIHPNHGFGAILPGETINLHLIYSACLMDIPGNEIGANGMAGERIFQVQVVSLAELAGRKGRTQLNKLKNLQNVQSMITRKCNGLPPPMSLKLINETANDNHSNRTKEMNNDFTDKENSDEDYEESEDATTEKSYRLRKRKKKNVMDVRVYIVDTFCELSEQIIEFPATPCGSFSMVSIHLRGFNVSSYPHCTCGIVKNQVKEFTARFKFKSSSDQMEVVPPHGVLYSNQYIQVNFIFKPRLPQNVVFDRDNKLKIDIEEEKKFTKDDKSVKKGKASKKASKKKESSEEQKEQINELPSEIDPLETLEPSISTIFVTCVIDLETRDNKNHNELLFAKLICPVTKPDIIILKGHEIDFGSTGIGLSSRQLLFVKNISTRSVKVDVSLLDPYGPFFIPPGKIVETGSILKLPVTYRPTQEGQEEEYFEVGSPETRTRWRLRVAGCGVVPSYVVKPKFGVARYEVIGDEPVELKMAIQNTGTCPLIFQLCIIDVLEGNIPREQQESPDEPKKGKKKKTVDGGGDRSSSRKAEFRDNLQPQEASAIFGENLKQSPNRRYFSFGNLDENMQLIVHENKKEQLERFTSKDSKSVHHFLFPTLTNWEQQYRTVMDNYAREVHGHASSAYSRALESNLNFLT